MSLADLKAYLRENCFREAREEFGLRAGPWIDQAVENWFNDTANYDRRWHVIQARRPLPGRVLDVAAGCGTFMLYGLNHGHDVYGIEPEPWKREYYRRKVLLSGYSPACTGRMVAAVGETLPFASASFDLVSTYQTLEHVADVRRCIHEMLRVLRPGGVLYLRAPDYHCFFEPHYRLPFLPKMNRRLAERYLSLLGRPLAGLRTLNWVTRRAIERICRQSPHALRIEQNRWFFVERRRQQFEQQLPRALRPFGTARLLNSLCQAKRRLGAWAKVGRQERVIDLWITKLPAAMPGSA